MNNHASSPLLTVVPIMTLAGCLFFPISSQAVTVSGIAKLGYDFGGDKMISATLVSSSGNSSNEAIYANSGLVLAGGVSIMNEARNFSVDTTIGWKSDSINASNQDFEFTRYPLDVIAFYNFPVGSGKQTRMRIGAGATSHINPKFTASGSLAAGTVNFDNSVGFIAQIDAVLGRGRSGLNFGIRFTSIQYEADSTSSLQANGAGLFVGGMF